MSSGAPDITGGVADQTLFQKGGTLFLGSFRAGVGAAADEETDLISAMLIKGIRDTLPQESSHFTLLANDQGNADFLLEGHINDFTHKGRFSRLSVDGEIWIRETGDRVFLFQHSSKIDFKTQDPKAVAYQLGVSIAHFIGSH